MGDVIFLGDVHLSPAGGASTDRFVRFLDDLAGPVEHLVVLGDLFDLWVGRGSARVEAYQEPIRALRDVARRGVTVTLLWGNRDFLLDAAFARRLGAALAGPSIEITCGGVRVHATHGDAFLTNDWGYRALTIVLRHPWTRAAASLLPHAWTWGIGMALRRKSVRATARKGPRAFAVSDRALERLVDEGVDLVVCGHVHRHERRTVRGARRTGTFLSLEAFGETGALLRIRGGELRLETACMETGGGYPGTVRPGAPRPDSLGPPGDPRASDRSREAAGPLEEVVTLDGPAGCGKSSAAQLLARRLGFAHLDSGATYRAATWDFLRREVDLDDRHARGEALAALRIRIENGGRVWVGDEEVTKEIRSPRVGAFVSRVAACAEVREVLIPVQRAFARGRRVVAEGRDMGTVVFPRARWKFFLDADPRVRAERRRREEGDRRTIEEVTAELESRDRLDASREKGPLRPAKGARRLDTTRLSLEEVVAWIERRVRPDLETSGVGGRGAPCPQDGKPGENRGRSEGEADRDDPLDL